MTESDELDGYDPDADDGIEFGLEKEDIAAIEEATKIYASIEANIGLDNPNISDYAVTCNAEKLVGIFALLFDLIGSFVDYDIDEAVEMAAVEREMVIGNASVDADKPVTYH